MNNLKVKKKIAKNYMSKKEAELLNKQKKIKINKNESIKNNELLGNKLINSKDSERSHYSKNCAKSLYGADNDNKYNYLNRSNDKDIMYSSDFLITNIMKNDN